jgi:16S rRNA (guanine(527)-N(7))-methyltransferase RsmG
MTSLEQTLGDTLERWGIAASEREIGLMRRHYELVVEANRCMNLTRITGEAEAAIKHYADSLALLLWLRANPVGEGPLPHPPSARGPLPDPGHGCATSRAGGRGAAQRREETPLPDPGHGCATSRAGGRGAERSDGVSAGALVDIGTGAGFPAIPMAIMCPELEVWALDGTGKKAAFVREAAGQLGLDNVRAVHARAEQWQPGRRFSLVTVRAVGVLEKCLKWTAHLVAGGGHVVCYKTASTSLEEVRAGERAARRLRLRPVQPFPYELVLAGELMRRSLFVYAAGA